jgi:hypothetical protein
MNRLLAIAAMVLLSSCATSPQQRLADDLEESSKFFFEKPPIYDAPRGGTPYAAQEEHHATVEEALREWVETHSDHIVCVSQREARIGVLALELPECAEFQDQYAHNGILDPPGLEIGPINVGIGSGNYPFVSLTVFEFGYAGNVESRSGQVYACIQRGNSIVRYDGQPWKIEYPDRRLPYRNCALAGFIIVV